MTGGRGLMRVQHVLDGLFPSECIVVLDDGQQHFVDRGIVHGSAIMVNIADSRGDEMLVWFPTADRTVNVKVRASDIERRL
jgi:hypothetical protein